ncbi:MAG: NUDIX domain-containing protein [Clostridiaceae bacterium]|jgi:bis(5'-nucleosidyl)-tetraphosphatase|nr:NUDIX domain-containing protein [Clostridiaceae bacterium]
MKYEKSCGAIIIGKQNRVLLIKHVNGGHWSFPKGHMKDNELEEQTALREIKEETGLDVVLDTGFRFVNTYSPTENVIKDVVYFLGFTEEREPVKQDEEVNEAGWFTFDEALRKITYDNDRKLLIAAREYIEIHVL